MIYALKERIGDPSLFCGRKEQISLLMNWANKIPSWWWVDLRTAELLRCAIALPAPTLANIDNQATYKK